uniref:Uncharacterized protein n=1 Tax=Cacopsylla melanoneura TaxID=428564 RepID=A0A8D8WL63_9HEMI
MRAHLAFPPLPFIPSLSYSLTHSILYPLSLSLIPFSTLPSDRVSPSHPCFPYSLFPLPIIIPLPSIVLPFPSPLLSPSFRSLLTTQLVQTPLYCFKLKSMFLNLSRMLVSNTHNKCII